jgi:hypothetical protein
MASNALCFSKVTADLDDVVGDTLAESPDA